MALVQIDYPANLTDQADFSAHGDLIEAGLWDKVNSPLLVVDGNIPQGAVLQIGSDIYHGTSDTAISGTASDYVEVTPDGEGAATAKYITLAEMSGVAWNAQYNGYYNSLATKLYIFDEGKALAAGAIAAVFGRYLAQQANGDVAIGRDLDVGRRATVGSEPITNTSPSSAIRVPVTGTPGEERVYMELQGVSANDATNEDGGAFVKFRTSTQANYGPEIGAVRKSGGSGDLLIKTGGSAVQERMRILDNGNVGIGKTPTTKLDVDGAIAGTSLNTGQGAHQLGQSVRTTDNVTFNTVNARGVDTFGGFHRLTGNTDTTMAVGSIVIVYTPLETYTRNSEIVIRISTVDQHSYTTTGVGAILTGTWRSRGYIRDDQHLAQRTET